MLFILQIIRYVDLKHPQCKCGIYPLFGYTNDKKPKDCNNCKLPGMINIISKKCKCVKQSCYGLPINMKPVVFNAKSEMIDVINPKCQCGYKNDKRATCCSKCKAAEMVDVKPKKCTSIENCPRIVNPYYDGYCYNCFYKVFTYYLKVASNSQLQGNLFITCEELKIKLEQ